MFAPAATEAWPVLVTEMSVTPMTVAELMAVLLPLFGALLSLPTVTVLVNVAPFGTLLGTAAVSVNDAVAPLARVGHEQPTLVGDELHVAAGPVFCTMETNDVCGGRLSVKWALFAGSGPLFVMVMVYEMFCPAVTVAGPVLVTARSAEETIVLMVEESFSGLGSWALVTEAVLVKVVPAAVPPGMCPVSVKSALAPTAIEAMVQVTVPPEPTDGFEQLNAGPVFCTIDTKVILPGRVSVSLTVCAIDGALLTTWMV